MRFATIGAFFGTAISVAVPVVAQEAQTPAPVQAQTPAPVQAQTPAPVQAQTPAPVQAQTNDAAPTSQQPTQPNQQRPYRINPGDELEVYVWGEERLQRTIKVLPDGTFSFPLVGRIDALNKLPAEIESAVTVGLRGQYRDTVPQVTVSVRSAVGFQFSIAGKVRSPGAFTPGRYVNVLEALALAGGPADFADMANVRILRKAGSGLNVIRVRLNDVLKGNPSSSDLTGLPQLESGDTVIVP